LVSRAAALYPKIPIESHQIENLIHAESKLFCETKKDSDQNTATLSVIKEIEKQMILKRLTVNRGNQKKTAQELGMPKSTLHDRIRNYNISLSEFRQDN
jgi:DNA-binding NtrC family response regulator